MIFPRTGVVDFTLRLNKSRNVIMWVEKPVVIASEGDMNVFTDILFVEAQSPLQLDFEKSLAIDRAGDEVGTLPVVGKAKAVKSVAGHSRGNFVEVEIFLLA